MAVFLLALSIACLSQHTGDCLHGIKMTSAHLSQAVNAFCTYTLNSIIRISQQYNKSHHITQMATIAETKDNTFQHC